MKTEIATVKVYRFDPRMGGEPRFDTYQVPYNPELSVLGTLRYIRENLDGGLAFRYGCEGSQPCKCGACVVILNGQPVLSCQQKAEPSMVIEPHWKYRVVKDLVVDLRSIVRQRGADKVARQRVSLEVDLESCNGCGDCVAVCPAHVWKLYKRKAVPNDADSCCGPDCGQCSQYCPQRAIAVWQRSAETA